MSLQESSMAEDGQVAFVDLLREVVGALARLEAQAKQIREDVARLESMDMAAHKALGDETRKAVDSMAYVTALWNSAQQETRREAEDRSKLIGSVFSNQYVQLLLAGLVMALLQAIGVGWYIHSITPETLTPHAEVTTP